MANRPPGQPDLKYDVCLSFASEQRDYVREVKRELQQAGLTTFFDEDEESMLWGNHLHEVLDDVYRKSSRFCVMFISREYGAKMWTNFERRSALARAMKDRHQNYLLPARFDDTVIEGLLPTVLDINLRMRSPAQFAQDIIKKVGLPTGVPRGGSASSTSDSSDLGSIMSTSTTPDQNSVFVVSRQILELTSVALGRLVLDTHTPWERYCPYMPTVEEKDIGIIPELRVQEILEETKRAPAVHGKFAGMLSRLLGHENLDTVIGGGSYIEKSYILPNAAFRFREACGKKEVREWLEDLIMFGIEPFLIVGLHTVSGPGPSREIVVGIKYWKVKYGWFWRKSVDKTFLERSDVWQPTIVTKGTHLVDADSEVVHPAFYESLSVKNLDIVQGDIVYLRNGEVIVL